MSFMRKSLDPSKKNVRMTLFSVKEKGYAEKIIAVIAALVMWQITAMLIAERLLLVTPVAVVSRLATLVVELSFWQTVAYSFLRIVLGFILALLMGLLLGVLAGRMRIIEILLWPYMAVVKSTPVASFIILCLIWLGASSLSVFISFLIVLPIIYTNVLHGIQSTDKKLLEMAQVFRVSRWRRFYYIYTPHMKTYLLSACGIAIGLSWKAGVAAEVIGIPSGSIGERLYEAKIYLSSADLFSWTLVVVLVSVVFEKVFVTLLKKTFVRMETG